jgi:hypothetical protein
VSSFFLKNNNFMMLTIVASISCDDYSRLCVVGACRAKIEYRVEMGRLDALSLSVNVIIVTRARHICRLCNNTRFFFAVNRLGGSLFSSFFSTSKGGKLGAAGRGDDGDDDELGDEILVR